MKPFLLDAPCKDCLWGGNRLRELFGKHTRNVSMFDMDFHVTMPRMEKGYKNETQYSKLDYYFDGDKKPMEIGRGRNASRRVDSRLSWFAFQQQFFSVILRAPQQFASGELSVAFRPEDDPDRSLMTCSAQMRADLEDYHARV